MIVNNVAELVDQTLRTAGIPIEGVSIGNPADRTSWRVDFLATATPAHRTQAASILSTVAIDSAAFAVKDQKDAQGQIDRLDIPLKAIVLTLIDQLNVLRAALVPPLNPITPAQALAAIRAKAGTL